MFELCLRVQPDERNEDPHNRQAERVGIARTYVDRKSTRLNSSHPSISYAVFCFAPHLYLHSFPTRRSSDLQFERHSTVLSSWRTPVHDLYHPRGTPHSYNICSSYAYAFSLTRETRILTIVRLNA